MHVVLGLSVVYFITSIDYALHYGLTRPPLAQSQTNQEAHASNNGRGADSSGSTVSSSGSGTVRYSPITPYSSWNSAYPIEVRLKCTGAREREGVCLGGILMREKRSVECGQARMGYLVHIP